MSDRFATASIAEIPVPSERESPNHRSLTDLLGCSATSVDGYRLPAGGSIEFAGSPEQVCIQLEADESSSFDGPEFRPGELARVPAGVECHLRSSAPAAVLVVSAPGEASAGDDVTTVSPDACDYVEPETSSIETARLTARLGCTGTKVNARILAPGEHVPYHTEGDQEELFVPIRGPATMRVDGETYETPVGTITRVAPPVPRSAVNPGEQEALWVMIGAPPTGSPDEWDPGAEMLE